MGVVFGNVREEDDVARRDVVDGGACRGIDIVLTVYKFFRNCKLFVEVGRSCGRAGDEVEGE